MEVTEVITTEAGTTEATTAAVVTKIAGTIRVAMQISV